MFRFLHWRSLFRRQIFEADLGEEFAFHLQARTEDLMRSGLSREQAERHARLEFGGKERYRAECRQSHRVHLADEFVRNTRYAVRNLLRSPLFAFTGVLSLALGLAAVGLMFAIADAILLQPLPFARSNRIAVISQKIPFFGSSPTVVTADEFQRWRQTGVFESSALLDAADYTLEQAGRPEQIYGASVTPDFFHIFGLGPMMGRTFSSGDAVEGRSSVIVLSYQLWARAFGSDPAVIGKTIHLSRSPFTVIGVMPAGFTFPRLADVSAIMNWAPPEAEFWIPFVITPQLIEQGNFNFYALGRLRDGITPERAAAQLLPSAVHLFKEKEIKYPQYKSAIDKMLGSLVIYVTPLKETMAWGVRDVLWMLLGAVTLVLVLVLFNLGNLLLTRNAHRLREYTLRQALGAGRWQLFRQSVFEQAVLVGLASAIAAVLIAFGIRVLRSVALDKLPRLHELHFTLSDVGLLFIAAFLVAVIFGALSQFLLSEQLLAFGLNSQGRTSTGDRRTSRLRSGLIAGEIAASLVLLTAAGLLLKSFRNVMAEQPGFNPQHLLTVSVPFNPQSTGKPENRLKHIRELLEAFDHLPGVTAASVVNRLPLTGDNEIHNVQASGKPVLTGAENSSAEYRVVDTDYFRTMQIPLMAGRSFRPADPPSSAVVNHQMAARLWRGEDPIGKQFSDGDNPPLTVIGVVGDVHNSSLEKPPMMQFYRLFTADPFFVNTFVIRSPLEESALLPLIQKIVVKFDPSEPVTHPQTMEHLLTAVTLPRRFETALLSGFAAVALFLSALGSFAVASLSAARRTREFGIRLAVGATARQIVRLELARTAMILIGGIGCGLLASVGVARAMTGFLYKMTPWSADIFLSATLVLAIVALLAGWMPAWRAGRIDPVAALHIE